MNFCPSNEMQGLTLSTGWTVLEKISKPHGSTGGAFSVPYIVEKQQKQAFMKVIDFTEAIKSPDFMKVVQKLSSSYNFEKEVLDQCNFHRLDKVVKLVEARQESVKGYQLPASYIIFEMASNGDVRKFLDSKVSFDLAWILRSLHHATIGMSQLHINGIAHQDLKPSNVLIFDEVESKIADLGRAIVKGSNSPHENAYCAGDLGYAPIELLYGHIPTDWSQRRLGCDLYLLGSLVMFYFSKTGITSKIIEKLAPQHRPFTNNIQTNVYWKGTYEEIYPYVENAFYESLRDFDESMQFESKNEIVTMVEQLCHPNVLKRGNPAEKLSGGNHYSLQRYISLLDRLATKAEYEVKRGV